jgi:hypothetical protein
MPWQVHHVERRIANAPSEGYSYPAVVNMPHAAAAVRKESGAWNPQYQDSGPGVLDRGSRRTFIFGQIPTATEENPVRPTGMY